VLARGRLSIDSSYAADRERIRQGGLRGEQLLAWLADVCPRERDVAFERLLGIAGGSRQPSRLGDDLIGYIPSGVAPIVRAVFDVPITATDIFVDLGSGLGKVLVLVHLLTGAPAQGIELEPELIARARESSDELSLLGLSFFAGDARGAHLEDGTVFFLYLPFTGRALSAVLLRLRAVAERRDIVVCTLGFDLTNVEWLVPRTTDAFWLSIYDSRCPGAAPGEPRHPSPLSSLAQKIVFER
jgi:SAM-dependent methyltransferase